MISITIIIGIIISLVLITSIGYTIINKKSQTGKLINVDCEVGSWSSCSLIDNICKKTRLITTPKQGEGKECPFLTDICQSNECTSNESGDGSTKGGTDETSGTETGGFDIDCEYKWNDCNVSCGGGTQSITILQEAKGSGAPCPTELSRPCNTEQCSVDCVMDEWSNCRLINNVCKKTRGIKIPKQGNGSDCLSTEEICPAIYCLNGDTETNSDNTSGGIITDDEKIDCELTEWSACNKPCDGGTQTREIKTNPNQIGTPCPTNPNDYIRYCNTQECDIDCVLSEWSNCDVSCGGGIQTKYIIQPGRGKGKPCSTNISDYRRPCNEQPCPIDCIVSKDWTGCSAECGGGVQYQEIIRQPNETGAPCPPLSERTRSCNEQSCDVDCIVSDWTPCDKECDGGFQYRSVIRGSQGNGKPCPILWQRCNTEPCNVDCQVGPWSTCDISCGTCTVTRQVIVPKKGNGADCPPLEDIYNTWIPCDRDCMVGEWSACSKSCDGGIRTRNIIIDKKGTGEGCPHLEEPCNTQPCPESGVGIYANSLVIKRTAPNDIKLSEIKVYDKNSNSVPIIISPFNIKVSSQPLVNADNLVDNNLNTSIVSVDSININFGQLIDVTAIEVVPSSDVTSQQSHILELLDVNNKIVWSTSLATLIKPSSLHAFYTKVPSGYNFMPSSSGIFSQMGENYDDWVLFGTPDDCARKCTSNSNCDGFTYSKVKQTDEIYSQQGYWCFFSDKNENLVDNGGDPNFNYYPKNWNAI